jgi:hypothetical protein
MSGEPDNLVLTLLRDMRENIRDMRANMATKSEIAELKAELKSDIHSLRADVASDLHALDAKIDATRKDLCEQIVGLRRAVVEYHSSTIGHGVLLTELEDRVRRLERRFETPDAH